MRPRRWASAWVRGDVLAEVTGPTGAEREERPGPRPLEGPEEDEAARSAWPGHAALGERATVASLDRHGNEPSLKFGFEARAG